MAARKRARTSSTGGSSSCDTSVTTIKLSGGWALPPSLVSLWRSGQLTDTVVTVEGRGFDASKNVLASGSEYFRSHFLNEQMERGAANPTLKEHVSAAAFEPLIDFLYEGECSFDEARLTAVLQAASFLTVKPLEQAAVAALSERLSPSNALAAWSLADQLSLPELAEAAKETALKGFDEVEKKIEEATLAQVQALVADDRLTAKSEEAVFSAVARFAEAKQPAEAELLGLMRNVRFAQMSRSFLHETARLWPPLRTVAGQELLLEMCMPLVSGPTQQPRHGLGARFLYVLGGSTAHGGGTYLSTVEIYDVHDKSWAPGTPSPGTSLYAAAAELDGKIHVMGGFPATNAVQVLQMGLQVEDAVAWATGAPMASNRYALATAVVGGTLYAFGSFNQSSVEAFDPHTGAWAKVAPMPNPRGYAGAAVADGKIYLIGGSVSNRALATVDVYDPQTSTWAASVPMPSVRVSHAVAALGGKIYVAGGSASHDPVSKRSSRAVDVFDPQTNAWASVAPMSTARMYFSLSAAQGKLYAAGGISEGNDALATVEAYDPQQDRWEAVAPMTTTRMGHATVTV